VLERQEAIDGAERGRGGSGAVVVVVGEAVVVEEVAVCWWQWT
jgi:hypothetical protein